MIIINHVSSITGREVVVTEKGSVTTTPGVYMTYYYWTPWHMLSLCQSSAYIQSSGGRKAAIEASLGPLTCTMSKDLVLSHEIELI